MFTRLTFAFIVALFAIPSSAQTDLPPADPTMEVLDVLAEASYNVSVAVFPIDDPESGFYLNERAMRPLGAVSSILVLAEMARRVEEDELELDERVPVDSVEAFYFEAVDNGAHASAMAWLDQAGKIEDGTISIDDIANVIARFGDTAASDYLIMRFGKEAMEGLQERVGTLYAEPPIPSSGMFLSIDLPREFGEEPTLSSTAMSDRAWHFAGRLRNSWKFVGDMRTWMDGFSDRMIYYDLSAAVLAFPAGSAQAYSDFMAQMESGDLISSDVSEMVLDYLNWPMQSDEIDDDYSEYATIGGRLPSIVTSTYLVNREGSEPPMALALLIEGLSEDVWTDWMATGKHSAFEQRLLTDQAFRYVVIERLRDK